MILALRAWAALCLFVGVPCSCAAAVAFRLAEILHAGGRL